nr:preprotein translocase subunit YajC [Protofrankia coriariae]
MAQNGGGGGFGGLFPLILLLALVVFFVVSQRRRQRTQQQVLTSLAPGALVVTTAGLYATVVEVEGSDVLLEVAPDVVCRFTRSAVVRVVSPVGEDGAHHDDHDIDHDGGSDGGHDGDEEDGHRDEDAGAADDHGTGRGPVDTTKKVDTTGGGETTGGQRRPDASGSEDPGEGTPGR